MNGYKEKRHNPGRPPGVGQDPMPLGQALSAE
jgi:hypothetical protein